MSNTYFKFKQFAVNQENTAMKVGVDAVLLGALAKVSQARTILDIGTGTGLLSLMLAQKSLARIVALEIDEQAYIQAQENIRKSPWFDRIKVLLADFVVYQHSTEEQFDFIICNPPYFNGTLPPLDQKRFFARHDHSLSVSQLFAGVDKLLFNNGCFTVIYPFERMDLLIDEAGKNGLFPEIIYKIKGNQKKTPNRIVVEFKKEVVKCAEYEIIIRDCETNEYSRQYRELTKDYYLKF